MPRLTPFLQATTATPLARDHERFVADGTVRKRKAIPWARFDRRRHPPAALALAFDTHRKLAVGEYGAISLFSLVTSALVHNGAPLDLVSAAARTADDELRHASYALRMASLCAGREIGVRFDRGLFDRLFCHPIEWAELDAIMLDVPTIGETIAAALLYECRARATETVSAAMLASLLADEVHHARLGWYYLSWRAPQWTRAERQQLANRAGALVQGIEHRFWKGRDAPRGMRRAAWALGVLESSGQRTAIRRLMKEELLPGLDALGLGASLAWRGRKRGAR